MRSIWKFKLETTDKQSIMLPLGAEILTVQTQKDEPYIWVMVDTNAPHIGREISIHGTGHPVTEQGLRYIGSYQLSDGDLVFHVFERIKRA